MQAFRDAGFSAVGALNVSGACIHRFDNNIQICTQPYKIVNIAVCARRGFEFFVCRGDCEFYACPKFGEVADFSPVVDIFNINPNRNRLYTQITIAVSVQHYTIFRILTCNIPLQRVSISDRIEYNKIGNRFVLVFQRFQNPIKIKIMKIAVRPFFSKHYFTAFQYYYTLLVYQKQELLFEFINQIIVHVPISNTAFLFDHLLTGCYTNVAVYSPRVF
nr:MAG TPA: hypothetical protein [Caudoviricetes sp.]